MIMFIDDDCDFWETINDDGMSTIEKQMVILNHILDSRICPECGFAMPYMRAGAGVPDGYQACPNYLCNYMEPLP